MKANIEQNNDEVNDEIPNFENDNHTERCMKVSKDDKNVSEKFTLKRKHF